MKAPSTAPADGERVMAVTLRALSGRPLESEPIRRMVVAAARGLAERQGLALLDVRAEDDRVTAVLAAPRVVALVFAAELRRLTTDWHTRKYGQPTLWGEPTPVDDREARNQA